MVWYRLMRPALLSVASAGGDENFTLEVMMRLPFSTEVPLSARMGQGRWPPNLP